MGNADCWWNIIHQTQSHRNYGYLLLVYKPTNLWAEAQMNPPFAFPLGAVVQPSLILCSQWVFRTQLLSIVRTSCMHAHMHARTCPRRLRPLLASSRAFVWCLVYLTFNTSVLLLVCFLHPLQTAHWHLIDRQTKQKIKAAWHLDLDEQLPVIKPYFLSIAALISVLICLHISVYSEWKNKNPQIADI